MSNRDHAGSVTPPPTRPPARTCRRAAARRAAGPRCAGRRARPRSGRGARRAGGPWARTGAPPPRVRPRHRTGSAGRARASRRRVRGRTRRPAPRAAAVLPQRARAVARYSVEPHQLPVCDLPGRVELQESVAVGEAAGEHRRGRRSGRSGARGAPGAAGAGGRVRGRTSPGTTPRAGRPGTGRRPARERRRGRADRRPGPPGTGGARCSTRSTSHHHRAVGLTRTRPACRSSSGGSSGPDPLARLVCSCQRVWRRYFFAWLSGASGHSNRASASRVCARPRCRTR